MTILATSRIGAKSVVRCLHEHRQRAWMVPGPIGPELEWRCQPANALACRGFPDREDRRQQHGSRMKGGGGWAVRGGLA
ncbi:MAG: hypothetical protein CMJ87_04355 [Planctomycetes bacterium]|nr:hypothetical protein [Planctomycetota bacterium]